MAVLMETSLGDLEIDLYVDDCPMGVENFLKLCKCKYYNYSLFHRVVSHFVAQTGDPTGSGQGGSSVWGLIDGESKRFFPKNDQNRFKHTRRGQLSFVNDGNNRHGSQFFITLSDRLDSLDGHHSVFGEVAEESFAVLEKINRAVVDDKNQPYQDIRIRHTIVLDDPFPDPAGLPVPDKSPLPTKEQIEVCWPCPSAARSLAGRIGEDEKINEFEGMTEEEVEEIMRKREAAGRAQILEMIGDLPDADVKPPENILFVCKLNAVTTDEDLRLIFARFGKILSCEIIRDWKSGDSLQYAFIEFENAEDAEEAYFKMDNVLIDDRRIHVDFSQSVAKSSNYLLPRGWKLGGSKVRSIQNAFIRQLATLG
ncbi:uncharacterized protein MONBRDRAFT_16038 [Monosiga brevicollis MX1]|uniref:Peptidyl-prolyl cis-trans isomerase n=1 Tax=Monosiga brevicollis TaxID=81824 RepID=A9UW42_MONBE|nr:uncharacterized protein MONBRDRAFT_16038 [Monosiga brevicollis MX1]EDQ90496.1 predicted protein [Monosiga brevicollis MX1]|eukprot:XP_001744547.1 hypothetical protein [Monosiga brevicollis MX1]